MDWEFAFRSVQNLEAFQGGEHTPVLHPSEAVIDLEQQATAAIQALTAIASQKGEDKPCSASWYRHLHTLKRYKAAAPQKEQHLLNIQLQALTRTLYRRCGGNLQVQRLEKQWHSFEVKAGSILERLRNAAKQTHVDQARQETLKEAVVMYNRLQEFEATLQATEKSTRLFEWEDTWPPLREALQTLPAAMQEELALQPLLQEESLTLRRLLRDKPDTVLAMMRNVKHPGNLLLDAVDAAEDPYILLREAQIAAASLHGNSVFFHVDTLTPVVLQSTTKALYKLPPGLTTSGNAEQYIVEHTLQLGKGAFGIVQPGRNTVTQQHVVVKRMFRPSMESMMANELTALRAQQMLLADVLVAKQDLKEAQELHIIMRRVPGKTLTTAIQDARIHIPPSWKSGLQLLQVFTSAAKKLDALHAHNLIHGDVKPPNCVVDLRRGAAVWIDFGLAHPIPETATAENLLRSVQRKSADGTQQFMAPEIMESFLYSPASDVYAFAVTLRFMEQVRDPLSPIPDVHEHLQLRLLALVAAHLGDDPATRPTMELLIGELELLTKAASEAKAVEDIPPASSVLQARYEEVVGDLYEVALQGISFDPAQWETYVSEVPKTWNNVTGTKETAGDILQYFEQE